MPTEDEIIFNLIEPSCDEVIDLASFETSMVDDESYCTISIDGSNNSECRVKLSFTHLSMGLELDEDCFSHEEMIAFALEFEWGYVEGQWQDCEHIVWSEFCSEYLHNDDAMYGWINRLDMGYFHNNESYIRCNDIYVDSDVAELHDVYYYQCCDDYVHQDNHDCYDEDSCDNDDDAYFVNDSSYNESQSLKYQKRYGTNSPTFSISNGMRYTFGVEIETSEGSLDDWSDLNVKSVYDGSTSGPEYVTGVLKGDNGFNNLKKLCNSVNESHKINKRCGIHVHVGGQFNRLFTIMILRLGYQIQDEIYRMLPPSRLNNNYCKYIPDYVMKMDFNNWRKYLGKYIHGDGNTLGKNANKKSRLGSYPSTRYRWINCINYSSASGKPTVEFRNHSASMDYNKIRNWTLICMAIVRFAQNNQKRIWYNLEDITLSEVIMTSLGSNIGMQINKYYKSRLNLFAHHYEQEYKDRLPSGYTDREIEIE